MSYRYSEEELSFVGDALWENRWSHLIQMEFVEGNPRWTSYRRAMDMNIDGSVTISDVALWGKWLFWLPGDYSIIAIMKWAAPIASFFELDPSNLTGVISSLISLLVWLLVVGAVANTA